MRHIMYFSFYKTFKTQKASHSHVTNKQSKVELTCLSANQMFSKLISVFHPSYIYKHI